MGFAQSGTIIRSGDPLVVKGISPSGLAVAGQVAYHSGSLIPAWNFLTVASVAGLATTITTAPIDTSGANCFIFVGSINGTLNLIDNQGNSWNDAVSQVGFFAISIIQYCINPNTATNHTFTVTSNGASSFIILAFKAARTPSLDLTVGNTTAASSSIQLIPLMPSMADSLIVSGIVTSSSGGPQDATGINQDFILVKNVTAISNVNFGSAAAYLIQSGGPYTVDPTWTVSASNNALGVTMASFSVL